MSATPASYTMPSRLRTNRHLKYCGAAASHTTPDFTIPNAAFQSAENAALRAFNEIEVLMKDGTTRKLVNTIPLAADRPDVSAEKMRERRLAIARDAALAVMLDGGNYTQSVCSGIQDYMRKLPIDVSAHDGVQGYANSLLAAAKEAYIDTMKKIMRETAVGRSH